MSDINKVVYGDRTLIDLTNDTVDEDNVLEGYTFHASDGSIKTGKAKSGSVQVIEITMAEYKANKEYYDNFDGFVKIIDAGNLEAIDVDYDNSESGLESKKVQGAIDEINSKIPVVVDDLTSASTTDALSANQGRLLDFKIENAISSVNLLKDNVLKIDLSIGAYFDCRSGFGALTVYGFMQNIGTFAVDIAISGTTAIVDRIGSVSQRGLIHCDYDAGLQKVHIYSNGAGYEIIGVAIGYLL